jgi:type 2 lantibiotic biosynthesis protein LanM
MTQRYFQSSEWYRASTLAERVASMRQAPSENRAAVIDSDLAARRMASWQSQPPFSTDSYFAQRLQMEGLSEDELFHLLGEPSEAIQHRLPHKPEWLEKLEQAFDQPEASPAIYQAHVEISRNQGMGGFLAVIMPYVERARISLRRGIRALGQCQPHPPFDPDAIEPLLFENLQPQLVQLLSRTMALELNVARLQGLLQGETPEQRCESFMQRLHQPDVALALLQEYPVLARQLTICIDNWVVFSLEFLRHLCQDWQAIREAFQLEANVGSLATFKGGAGDRHRGGRTVVIVQFDSGFQIVYKPRSLAIDVHFQELLTWLNHRGDHPPFRTITVLDRDSHGWVEFVLPQPCDSTAQVQRFYERQGGYIALLHVLAATDCHYANLIAAGEHPVLVDIETLFHPSLELNGLKPADQPTARAMVDSVLRVGLLPYRQEANAQSEGIDLSGLRSVEGQLTPFRVPHWDSLGTDELRMTRRQKKIAGSANCPILHGQTVDVLAYRDAIAKGFTRVYQLLRQHRDRFMSTDGPLARFAHDETRVVLRTTRNYDRLLHEGYHPDVLRDALDHDRLFDRLWVQVERSPHLRRVIPDEYEDLQDGSIPKFTTRPTSQHLWNGDGRCIDNFFDETGMDVVRRRLQQLSDADLQTQLWFIHASLATLVHGTSQLTQPASTPTSPQPLSSPESLLQLAKAIGDRLAATARQGAGEATWLGMVCSRQGLWSLAPLRADLYGGLSGIALFLAYLGSVTGDDPYTELARSTLKTIQRQMEEIDIPCSEVKQNQPVAASVGGFDGWGGMIYTLVHLSVLWNQPSLLSEAEAAVRLLPPLIDADDRLDMVSGAAGCLGGLMSLYYCAPSQPTLDVAIRCGEHLIACAEPMASGLGWTTPSAASQPLVGFAHGAAGIAWALLHLTALTAQARFRTAALQAIAYERQFQSPAQHTSIASWSQGVTGIGLARLDTLQHLHDAATQAELHSALESTLAHGFGHNHSLSHGELGNLELLLQASLKLNEPRWTAEVQRLSSAIVDTIKTQGWLSGVPLGVESPGLMTGLAGIGYELLRLAAPARVPSVLVLEAPKTARC